MVMCHGCPTMMALSIASYQLYLFMAKNRRHPTHCINLSITIIFIRFKVISEQMYEMKKIWDRSQILVYKMK